MEKPFTSNEDKTSIASLLSNANNRKIECGLLGGLLVEPQYLYDVADIITPDMFKSAQNRKIYEAMVRIHSEDGTFDTVLLSKATGVTGSYIAELLDSAVSSRTIKKYTEELRSAHIDWLLAVSAESITALAINTKLTAGEKVEKSERLILDATSMTDNRKYYSMKDVMSHTMVSLEKKTPSEQGVTSGFKSIDKILFGFQKSDLVILAARPSVGKTTLAMDFVVNAAKSGVSVGMFSLEMSKEQLGARMVGAESKVGSWKIRNSCVTSEGDKEKVSEAIATLTELPIFIDDTSSLTISKIKSSARRMKKQENIGLIVVDYLQLITTTGNTTSSKNDKVSDISSGLKHLAKELKIPVIALSQLSRSVETRGGKPMLSDLRDSGSIEQDADIVMFIHREDRAIGAKEKTGIADILISKHRNGATGELQLMMDEKNTTFKEMEFAGNIDEF